MSYETSRTKAYDSDLRWQIIYQVKVLDYTVGQVSADLPFDCKGRGYHWPAQRLALWQLLMERQFHKQIISVLKHCDFSHDNSDTSHTLCHTISNIKFCINNDHGKIQLLYTNSVFHSASLSCLASS